jgi:branched-chain amino acid transport system substrate-binding protein
MKRIVALLLVGLMVFSLFGCSKKAAETTTDTQKEDTNAAETTKEADNTSGKTSGDPIKIGLTTVLTGDRALEGEYASNAAKIVQDEINEAGGVLGRPIEVVIEDALGTDVGAVNAFRKLAADKEITAIIGSDSSNDNMAISSSVLEAKILTTAQGSSPKLRDICDNDNPYLFQLRASDQTLCAALIKYAVEKQGLKSFAIIHDTETASQDQARLFTEALATYGLKPVITVPFTTGTKDFSSHLAQVQAAKPDAIIGAMFHTEGAILLQQIRSLGIELPFFGSNVFGDPITLQLAGEAMNDVYSAAPWVPNTPNPIGAAFAKKYKELYGVECAKSAAQIYDHVKVICEAIKIAGSTDRQAVRDAMQTINHYEGAITVYDMRTNGDCGRGGLIVQIKDLVPTIIEELYSEKVIK